MYRSNAQCAQTVLQILQLYDSSDDQAIETMDERQLAKGM
jgi:hypothetical protein